MLHKKLLFLAILFSFSVFSQQGTKELTLSDAVTEQYRSFYPEQPLFLQWIPNTHDYSYLKQYVTLVRESSKDKNNTQSILLNISEVNQWSGADFKWFSDLKWINANEFIINDGVTFLQVNPQQKTAVIRHVLEENADNVVFSDNLQSLAYTIDNNVYISLSEVLGESAKKVQVTNFSDKNIVSGQAIARSEFGISGGLFWSPDGQYIAFYQKDETDVSDYPLLDISTTPGTLRSIKYPMAGQKSEKPKVGVFNIHTQKTVYIQPKGNVDDYLTNLCFTPDSKFVIIAEVNRGQNKMWLNVYDAENGNFVRTLLEEENDKWVEPEHTAFFPDKSSNNFVWISEKNGFNNLYYYTFEGKLIRQLTDNSFVIDEIITVHKNTIYFYATGDNPLNTLVYSVDFKGKQTLLTKVEGQHTFALCSDGTQFYDGYSNHHTPFEANIYSVKGVLIKHLLSAADPLADYAVGITEIDTIRAKDGSLLYTRLIKPSNFNPQKKYPVLIYVYGGPHAQMITNSWYSGASLWMNWLAEQGYLVFTVDGRGSARRGFAFESQIHRQLGKVEMDDQLSGVEYLNSLGYIDEKRIAVHGWSFGGFMTASLLLHHPGVFTTGVAGGPVTDWKYYEIMYGERYMDRPEENPDGYQQTSLLTHVKNLKDNLLLIHGTIDDVVVMQHNFALVKQFIDLGIQVDFFPYPMHPHNVRGKDRVHLMTKVLNYIINNNK